MDTNKTYKRIIHSLKDNPPVLTNKDSLMEEVLDKIHYKNEPIRKVMHHYVFGWTSVSWIRTSMATAAVLLIGFFIFQQLWFNNRINSLEKQIVKTINGMEHQGPGLDISEKVLMNLITSQDPDSITISRKDFNLFIESYLELEKNYENRNNPSSDKETYKDRIIRKNLDKGSPIKGSKQNL